MNIRLGLINELHNNFGAVVTRLEIIAMVDGLNKDLSDAVYDENGQINDDFLELYDELSEILDTL